MGAYLLEGGKGVTNPIISWWADQGKESSKGVLIFGEERDEQMSHSGGGKRIHQLLTCRRGRNKEERGQKFFRYTKRKSTISGGRKRVHVKNGFPRKKEERLHRPALQGECPVGGKGISAPAGEKRLKEKKSVY